MLTNSLRHSARIMVKAGVPRFGHLLARRRVTQLLHRAVTALTDQTGVELRAVRRRAPPSDGESSGPAAVIQPGLFLRDSSRSLPQEK